MSTTKILKIDLDQSIQDLLGELIKIQGDSITLSDKLLNIDTSMMAAKEKAIIEDLKAMHLASGKHVSERIAFIEDFIGQASEEGNFTESFTYELGDIKEHTVVGDSNFKIVYDYNAGGDIIKSTKTYLRDNGDTVAIIKNYTYLNGDITGIATTTTVTPLVPGV